LNEAIFAVYEYWMPTPLLVTFAAGRLGAWRIDRIDAVIGDGLPAAERLAVIEDSETRSPRQAAWVLRGITSNTRYTNRSEADALEANQRELHRPQATQAALIPIRKTDAWWNLAQDERRAIFEEQSRHIGVGLEYLPAIARRLHHSRELGQPFDFLTWFEYAPEHSESFEELVRRLRETVEWHFVDREVDIRLTRI
jgi:chlorite dismutase